MNIHVHHIRCTQYYTYDVVRGRQLTCTYMCTTVMMTSHLLVVFIYRVRHSSSLATPVVCHGNVHILSITCVYMLHNASLITGYVTADGVHNQENMQLSSDPFLVRGCGLGTIPQQTPHTMIPCMYTVLNL